MLGHGLIISGPKRQDVELHGGTRGSFHWKSVSRLPSSLPKSQGAGSKGETLAELGSPSRMHRIEEGSNVQN